MKHDHHNEEAPVSSSISSSYPDMDSSAQHQVDSMIERYLLEIQESAVDHPWMSPDLTLAPTVPNATANYVPAGRAILAAGPALQIAVLREIVDRSYPQGPHRDAAFEYYYENRHIGQLANKLTRRKLAYTLEDVCWLLDRLARSRADWDLLDFVPVSTQALLRSIERWSHDHTLPPQAIVSLKLLRSNIADHPHDSRGLKVLGLISDLLGVQDDQIIDDGDDWGMEAFDALGQIPTNTRQAWEEVLTAAGSIRGTHPSQKWQNSTADEIGKLGESAFVALAVEWFALLGRPTRDSEYRGADGYFYPSTIIAERNADLLKGLAWACSMVAHDALPPALGDAALACYRKIPNFGARSTKAGNACVHALAAMPDVSAITQLQRVLQRVKLPSQRAQVEKALETAAAGQGYSRADLDELVVPHFGLGDGVVRRDFGDYSAELAVERSDTVNLRWIRPDGKAQKSVPVAVKRDFAADVKDLKRIQKEIGAALSAHKARIEQLLIRDRAWSYADWRERYFEHPLISLLTHRLIWILEVDGQTVVAGCLDGKVVGLDDQPVDGIDVDTEVRLWHPIESEAAEVLGWRQWLERHEIVQPFKQAHREIYILTDAERETEIYSNRFAAHIIRQHQFTALCQQRGWRYQLQGAWDGFNLPSLELAELGLRAEYWIEGIEHGHGLSHAGIYLYATTDQVRFADSTSGESIPLAEVPPRVFSEVMRDVDLFVAVASIGADPNWLDGGFGRLDGYGNYWWDYSFGELTAQAITRRDVLASVLPRMTKLEGRWELSARFLKVRGELRSYRIHLGSGNILMEPNDQYLCIVPGRGTGGGHSGDGLYLPFEGDRTLSVILSKALMLASDTTISDPTIVRQIAMKP